MKTFQSVLASLALAGLALAQSNPSGPKLEKRMAPQTADETSTVPPDAAVITIDGLCEKPAGSNAAPADCKTVVTRAEFEKLTNAIQPNMPAAAKKQFAGRYAVVLYLAEKAHEAGLDQGPVFDEKLFISRLQLLASLGSERVHQDAGKVTDGEVEAYYHDHLTDYKTISYDRLLVPKQKQVNPSAQKAGGPGVAKETTSEAEMKAEADKLRARAAAGEDFAKLQQEAYDFAGNSQTRAGNPRIDKMRKAGVPPADASIFELKVGEVSPVFDDPSGFVVYKIVAVEDIPVASVHDEISRKLASDRERGAIDSLQKSTKLDDTYFAPPVAVSPQAPPTLRNPGEAPSAPTPPAPTTAAPTTPAPGKH